MGAALSIQKKAGDRFDSDKDSNADSGIMTLQSGISHDKEWLKKMRTLFDLLDKDKSNDISIREIKHVLRKVGCESQQESRNHAKEILLAFDHDESGKVTFQEMVEVLDSVKPIEAQTMITDMLEHIHRYRHRNHIVEKSQVETTNNNGIQPRPSVSERSSVVEVDIETQDVVDDMLHAIADFQIKHMEGTRLMLTRCITELKNHKRIRPALLEGLEGDDKRCMLVIQFATNLNNSGTTGIDVITILEFMLTQLPPQFGTGSRVLKSSPQTRGHL